MITTFLFYSIVYFFQVVDYLLNQIPGISYVTTYSSRIGSAVNSFIGLAHQMLPETLALVATSITLTFAIWFVFFVMAVVKDMVPFLGD